MKKSLLGLVAIGALIATPAMAADLGMPLKAPPAPAPVVASWTGLYVGIDGGGGWGNESWLDNNSLLGCPPCFAADFHPDGGIFGGLIGARYQFNNNFVIGVEGGAAWADLEDTLNTGNPIFPGETERFKVNALYSATGQIGYAWNQALLYVKGGWAGANTNWNTNAPTAAPPPGALALPFTASNSQDNSGWTVGVGLDYQLINNLVVGIEYDHYDLGYANFTAPVSSGPAFTPVTITNASRLTIDSVVARLSYKFNWTPAPIATRY